MLVCCLFLFGAVSSVDSAIFPPPHPPPGPSVIYCILFILWPLCCGHCFGPHPKTPHQAKDNIGLAGGGQKVGQCRDKYKAWVENLIKLASLQTSFVTMDEALKVRVLGTLCDLPWVLGDSPVCRVCCVEGGV